MKRLIFFVSMMSIIISACFNKVDDIELNDNPFDEEFAYDMVYIDHIEFKESTVGGITKCEPVLHYYFTEKFVDGIKKIDLNKDLRYKMSCFFEYSGPAHPNGGINSTKIITINGIRKDSIYKTTLVGQVGSDIGDKICPYFRFYYHHYIPQFDPNTYTVQLQNIACFTCGE